jgi:hypothetical protein
VTPIKQGTAARLGLRKPAGVCRHRDGSTIYVDEARKWMETLGFHLEPWQQESFERRYLNAWIRP